MSASGRRRVESVHDVHYGRYGSTVSVWLYRTVVQVGYGWLVTGGARQARVTVGFQRYDVQGQGKRKVTVSSRRR